LIRSSAIWTVRAGKLARVEVYADKGEALEAAGLRD
jgi:ketosteroid isomerase-like protein